MQLQATAFEPLDIVGAPIAKLLGAGAGEGHPERGDAAAGLPCTEEEAAELVAGGGEMLTTGLGRGCREVPPVASLGGEQVCADAPKADGAIGVEFGAGTLKPLDAGGQPLDRLVAQGGEG